MTLIKRSNSLFPTFWNDFFENDLFNLPSISETGLTVPAVNIKETENEFEIELAAPGMKKEDFKINLDHNLLTISSEHKSENESKDEKGNYTRREFNYQSFSRAFTLPETVNADKIDASYKDGVLKIHLPKKEEAKPKPVKLIEVK